MFEIWVNKTLYRALHSVASFGKKRLCCTISRNASSLKSLLQPNSALVLVYDDDKSIKLPWTPTLKSAAPD